MKLKVKVGTLGFEQGIFQKGAIIEVTEERAKLFDKLDVEPIQEPQAAPVIVKPVVPEPVVTAAVEPAAPVVKKTTVKKTVATTPEVNVT